MATVEGRPAGHRVVEQTPQGVQVAAVVDLPSRGGCSCAAALTRVGAASVVAAAMMSSARARASATIRSAWRSASAARASALASVDALSCSARSQACQDFVSTRAAGESAYPNWAMSSGLPPGGPAAAGGPPVAPGR